MASWPVVGAARIVVVGSTMIDLVAYAERLPTDGETVTGREFRTGFGGKGANQAVMAARFDVAVTMVNALGEDDHGDAYLDQLAGEGIDTSFIRRVAASSGVASIWVDGAGTNRIVIIPGANLAVDPTVAVEAVEAVRPQVVIGQFEIPQRVTTAGFTAARSVGAMTILNPAPATPIEPDLLHLTDWLVPNETEFGLISGTALPRDEDGEMAAVVAFGRRVGCSLVVTLGDRGAAVAPLGNAPARVRAADVVAVDTTGAGDAFVGAFAVGLALGWSAVAAADLGCIAAADSVTRPGTQASYPDRAGAAGILRSMPVGAPG
ncbi:MAG TPA: ribokinase [Candidatus Limnocylindrales bacterium]|nr:ribokinase [Candidatus Limnocylindrales bacterium]